MKKYLLAIPLAVGLTACSGEEEPPFIIDPAFDANTLYVVNSGNYGAGNASLSAIDVHTGAVANDVFQTANGMRLGDVAQSMTFADGKGWVVVNNSGVIFAIDPETGRELGRIDQGLSFPRNIAFVTEEKAYVTQLYSNRIAIVNPKTYTVTGYIEVPGMGVADGSTEQIATDGRFAYVNCWSYQREIIKIDISRDRVVGSVDVGVQPCSLVLASDGMLHALTDGGWEGNPLGYEAPTLVTVDPSSLTVTSTLAMTKGDMVSKLTVSPDGATLYWLNGSAVYSMAASSQTLPATPLIQAQGWLGAIAVSPDGKDIYLADALDYQQRGVVYRYRNGVCESTWHVGVIPSAFCWAN